MTTETLPARMMDKLYHELLLPEETQEIRAEVRAFAEREIAPVAWELAQTEESVDAFPRELFAKMADAGLFEIPYAKENGGRGLRYPVCATVATVEELAYFSNSVAAIYDVHCILAGRTLEQGSKDIRDRYLRPLIAGEQIGSFATSEPLASTDLTPSALQTIAEDAGDHYVVNGHKRWITNSPVANFNTMLVRTGNALTKMVIDLDSEGVTVGAPDRKMGNRVQLTADIRLENVKVPKANVIGEVGRGLYVSLATLTYGRVGIGAAGVGMAQRVFDEMSSHLLEREAFGKKIGEFQHWQFLMADRATEIENARNLYAKAALRMDEGEEFPEPEAAMAKLYGTRLSVDIARDGVQAFGGYGFVRELADDGRHFKVEEIYRDSKIGEIYEGTNEIQKMVIARAIFGKNVTG